MKLAEAPDALLAIALALMDAAAEDREHAHALEAWSKHLAQDARGLALVVQALEPLAEL